MTNPFDAARTATIDLDETGGARATFAPHAARPGRRHGPRRRRHAAVRPADLRHSPEFHRNPYPYYRILRDHYPVFHDRLHNCYYVTRYDDITTCYFDEPRVQHHPEGLVERRARQHPARAERHRAPPAPQPLRPPPRRRRADEADAGHPQLASEMIDQLVADPTTRRASRSTRRPAAHDRARPGLRQRVPDPGRVPGARLPRRGPRVVLLLVPLDDDRASVARDTHQQGLEARAGPRGLRRGHSSSSAASEPTYLYDEPGNEIAWTSSRSSATPRSTATSCRPRRSRRTSRSSSAAAARPPAAPS